MNCTASYIYLAADAAGVACAYLSAGITDGEGKGNALASSRLTKPPREIVFLIEKLVSSEE